MERNNNMEKDFYPKRCCKNIVNRECPNYCYCMDEDGDTNYFDRILEGGIICCSISPKDID